MSTTQFLSGSLLAVTLVCGGAAEGGEEAGGTKRGSNGGEIASLQMHDLVSGLASRAFELSNFDLSFEESTSFAPTLQSVDDPALHKQREWMMTRRHSIQSDGVRVSHQRDTSVQVGSDKGAVSERVVWADGLERTLSVDNLNQSPPTGRISATRQSFIYGDYFGTMTGERFMDFERPLHELVQTGSWTVSQGPMRGGVPCVWMRGKPSEDFENLSFTVELLVSPARNFALEEATVETVDQSGQVSGVIRYKTLDFQGEGPPYAVGKASLAVFNGLVGDDWAVQTYTVNDSAYNVDFPEQTFKIAYPPGTHLFNTDTKVGFEISESGNPVRHFALGADGYIVEFSQDDALAGLGGEMLGSGPLYVVPQSLNTNSALRGRIEGKQEVPRQFLFGWKLNLCVAFAAAGIILLAYNLKKSTHV